MTYDYINMSLNFINLVDTVNQLTIEEMDCFGHYLYINFFECDEDDDEIIYTKSDILSMLEKLFDEFEDNKSLNNFILLLLDDLNYESADSDDTDEDDELVNEGVCRRMLPSHLNHKLRKFMKKSKSVLRRERTKRKRLNRLNRMKRKRYYRANKLKIKSYQRSRNAMIKKGRHIVKLRRRV